MVLFIRCLCYLRESDEPAAADKRIKQIAPNLLAAGVESHPRQVFAATEEQVFLEIDDVMTCLSTLLVLYVFNTKCPDECSTFYYPLYMILLGLATTAGRTTAAIGRFLVI